MCVDCNSCGTEIDGETWVTFCAFSHSCIVGVSICGGVDGSRFIGSKGSVFIFDVFYGNRDIDGIIFEQRWRGMGQHKEVL